MNANIISGMGMSSMKLVDYIIVLGVVLSAFILFSNSKQSASKSIAVKDTDCEAIFWASIEEECSRRAFHCLPLEEGR